MEEYVLDTDCPVCYENLTDTARTLSCGHVFCHDCLVKTLVCKNVDDGSTRDSIVCPVCRHLTFIIQQHGVLITTGPEPRGTRILKVPVSAQLASHTHSSSYSRGSSAGLGPNTQSRVGQCLRWASSRLGDQNQSSSDNNCSQVFIISDLGRPMTEDDAVNVVTVLPLGRSHRRRICSTSNCLLILLITFTLLALVAATAPWILLA
ncbi:RING finger protein 222 [Chanos chanos]|uniref:RING finger protein 222 n=1 Tax=Chanos chanos TaxID=29144 RepID=A0A6J2WQ11_CHACN|nr:RING finger protein 222 [Chanos chanos]